MTRRSMNGERRPWRAVLLALVFACGVLSWTVSAQTSAQQLISDAATAMGGRERILAVKTLSFEGMGHNLDINQGYRWDENGLQSDYALIRDYKRAFDLVNSRARFEGGTQRTFTFFTGESPNKSVQGLDGEVVFTVRPDGQATRGGGFGAGNLRLEYFEHPLVFLRTALSSKAELKNARTQGGEQLVDVTVPGMRPLTFTVAFDSKTKLPSRAFMMVDSDALGDRVSEVRFRDYRSIGGLQLPSRFTARTDQFETSDVRLLKQTVDGDVGNLVAPASVTAAAQPPAPTMGCARPGWKPDWQPPAPGATTCPVIVDELAKGLWAIGGTTHQILLMEFSDHVVMIDAPTTERVQAAFAKAKELRPNKPVTQLIMTHHHSDHIGGMRTAVALGVKEIIAHESNALLLSEMFKRPHTLNPDLYAKSGTKAPKITLIGDEGVVKDSSATINLYHLLYNSHADSQLMIYFPRERIVEVADVYMPEDLRTILPAHPLGWGPWGQNVLVNINLRKLQVDKMAPIHGALVPYSTFLENVLLGTTFLPKELQQPGTR